MARKPVVIVNLDYVAGAVTAEVLADGKPVQNAEVQWRPNAPWRAAPGGVARYVEPDPSRCLSSVRFNPLQRLLVTARVSSGSSYALSTTLEIDISEVN